MFSGQFEVKGRHVVITGGSQGLGAELGRQVIIRGASSVVLIARTSTKLQATVNGIEPFASESQSVRYTAADVSSYEECANAVASLAQEPDIVFMCAGSSLPKLFMDLGPGELKQGVDVNYNTSLYFSHAVLKRMNTRSEHRRHLVFCSSVLGVFPFIGYAQYAPSKAAVRSLSDVLRQECAHLNIGVECVYPGNFASEGYTEEEKTKPSITREIEGASAAISVEQCANIVLWWLDRGYESVYTDAIGWFLGCGALSMGPRVGYLLQVVVALLLSVISPVYMALVRRDISRFYKKEHKE